MRRVRPGEIRGSIAAPPSKSATQRAVFLASLADGESTIASPSGCDDALAAIRIAERLGAMASAEGGNLVVSGKVAKVNGGTLDCGESGFCARAAIPLAALHDAAFRVTGAGTLARRPLGAVEGAMASLGARCATTDGRVPASVKGPLLGGRASIDGSSGSQFLSGLLMALPSCPEDSELAVSNLKSKPYARLTLAMAEKFGAKVECDRELTTFAVPGGQSLSAAKVRVEGDWSSAAFLLAAGALAGSVKVGNLDLDSEQADRAIVVALKSAGAKVKALRGSVSVESAELDGFEFDASDCPDLFPPLAALATGCVGESAFSGASRLRGKETDRAAALVRQLGSMGANVRLVGDRLVVRGGKLTGGAVDPEGDHRIAMACAVAGLVSGKGVSIKGAECVSKSYPGFFDDLQSLVVVR